jgi:hypothetical protein
MTHLVWQETDSGYELEVEHGRAMIEKGKFEGNPVLIPQIYDESGDPIVEREIRQGNCVLRIS